MVKKQQPHGLSRTGYINYLIQLGLATEAQKGLDLNGHFSRTRGPVSDALSALTGEEME